MALNYSIGSIHQKFFTTVYDRQVSGVHWSVGTIYSTRSHSQAIGLFYERGISLGYQTTSESTINPEAEYNWSIQIPERLHLGVKVELNRDLSLLVNASYIFENKPTWRRHHEYSGSLQYNISRVHRVSLGIFADRKYSYHDTQDTWSGPADAIFITAGATARLTQFQIDLVIADSHFGAGEKKAQTLVKMGIGYSIQ